MPGRATGADGRAVLQEVGEDVLFIAAGSFAGDARIVAAGLDVKALYVAVGLRDHFGELPAAGVEGPNLNGVIHRRARAVAERIIEHHAELPGHASGIIHGGGRRRRGLPGKQRAEVRHAGIVSAMETTELEAGRGSFIFHLLLVRLLVGLVAPRRPTGKNVWTQPRPIRREAHPRSGLNRIISGARKQFSGKRTIIGGRRDKKAERGSRDVRRVSLSVCIK